MRAYLLTFAGVVTLFNAYGASWSGSNKTHVDPFTQGQTDVMYTINAHNDGSFDTNAPVTITDTLPTGLTNPRWTSVPAGWVCTHTATTATCTNSNNGAIPAGATIPLYLLVDVSNTAPAVVVNNVKFDGGGASNGFTYPDTTNINGAPSLTITKTQISPSYNGIALPVGNGQSITYKLDIDNVGRAATSGQIKVVDTLASDMVIASVQGNGFWFCTHTVTVATCVNLGNIPAAGAYPGEVPDIFVTASVLGSSANDVAKVTGGGSADASTPTVSTSVDVFSSVTISSNTGYVFADGQITQSPVTYKWDGSLTHTFYGYPNCMITAISGFKVSESAPAVAAPWTEVTGKATGAVIAITCK